MVMNVRSGISLNERTTRIAVGQNVLAIAGLLGKKMSSVAALAGVEKVYLDGLSEGRGKLTDEILSDLAKAFKSSKADVSPTTLLVPVDDDQTRDHYWTKQLREAGFKLNGHAVVTESVVPESEELYVEDEAVEELEELADAEVQVSKTLAETLTAQEVVEPLVWQDALKAKLGSQVFDLKSKDMRAKLISNVRAALNKANKNISQMLKAKVIASTGVVRSVEVGKALFHKNDIEPIALFLNVSVQQLLTGEGLEAYHVGAVQRGPSKIRYEGVTEMVGGQVMLPTISKSEYVQAFMRQMTSEKTTFVAGVNPVIILRQVTESGVQSVDWVQEWLTKTEQGAQRQQFIDKNIVELKKLAVPFQLLLIMGLVKGLWPNDNT